jgi:hypothetical protein
LRYSHPDALTQLNNQFFFGGSVGGAGASTNQTLAGQNTGGADAVPSIVQTITPGSVSGGVVAGFNGPLIDISGFRFIPGVVGSMEWMDASGATETISTSAQFASQRPTRSPTTAS